MNVLDAIPSAELDHLIDAALEEDGAASDSTVTFLGIGDAELSAAIVAGADGVVAGLGVAGRVFERVNGGADLTAECADGSRVSRGDRIARLNGRAAAILGGERVALNFLGRLSGIATMTAQFADRVRGAGIRILDTRKTTPLHRRLERYAVSVGGGLNHRFNLTDMVLVKENHIRAAGGPEALRRLLTRDSAKVPVEVEVDSLSALVHILGAPVQRIMLDNFSPEEVRTAVAEVRKKRQADPSFAPELEASGGITLHNIDAYAIEGLDFISVGALTHSAPALDLSLEVLDRDR